MQKKKTTAKKKSTKRNELLGILFIAVGLFLGACMLLSNTGFLGTVIRPVMLGVFGIAGFAMPIVICILGVALIAMHKRKIRYSKVILVGLMFFMTICVIHVIFLKDMNKLDYSYFIKSSYAVGQEIKGTGALAGIITYPVWSAIGTVGSLLTYLAVLIACIIVYGNLSLRQMGETVGKQVKTMSQRASERREIRQAERAEKKRQKQLYTASIEEDENPMQETMDTDFTFLGNHGNEVKNSIVHDIEVDEDGVVIENDEPPFDMDEPITPQTTVQKAEAITATRESSKVPVGSNKTISVNDVSKYKPVFDMREDAGFLHMLKQPEMNAKGKNKAELEQRANALEQALESFGVDAKVVNITCGPAITRFELQLAYGVTTKKITSLTNDIKMALAARDIRIEAPIPGKNAVGIEVPNENVRMVMLREVLESDEFLKHKSKLAFALGIDIDGNSIVADLERMPHLLIAGTTGSGKSVCINNLILSFLYNSTPEQVKMIMVDPKMVELASYNDLPHMLIPVVTDSKKAAGALRWALNEMEKRYMQFAKVGVRQLSTFNANADEDDKLPSVVVIVDELADLMMVAAQEVEEIICRIAQKGRAAGIHLVLATQRPSVNVITGVIKANVPSRIAFQVFSQVDSRTILDMAGAERLLGRGDMLYHPNGAGTPTRLQGAFVSEKEVRDITDYIKEKSEAQYSEEIMEQIEKTNDATMEGGGNGEYDELLPEAAKVFLDRKEASVSLLQRKMRIGYARAARIVDEMEEMGIVSGPDGSRPRDVLISNEDYNRMFGENG